MGAAVASQLKFSAFHPALVRAGYSHVFSVLRNRAARNMDAAVIELLCDLLVREWFFTVFLINHLLHQPLQR